MAARKSEARDLHSESVPGRDVGVQAALLLGAGLEAPLGVVVEEGDVGVCARLVAAEGEGLLMR